MPRVAIIGLGLIGGSIGLAIKASKQKDLEVVGADTYRRARKDAEKVKAVDETHGDARRAVTGAGLVIVATPPGTVGEVFKDIAPALAEGAAVTDVASTKTMPMKWAQEFLPAGVSYVGSHPMAGKTETGAINADADLFRGRPWAIVSSDSANDAAIRSVVGLAQMIGANEQFMSAEEHDHYAAAVSHLPIALSTALFTMLRRSESWGDFGKMAGPAYTDLTRLLAGDPEMNTDIMVTNRDQVQHWLDRFILELKEYRDLLDDTEDEVFQHFAQANINRTRFLAGEDLDPGPKSAEMPDSSSQMAALLMGPKAYDRLRDMTKRSEEKNEGPQRRRR